MDTDAISLRQLVVFLVAAGFVVPFAHRFRISPVLGFLVIGLLIGPHGAGRLAESVPALALITIGDGAAIHLLAELGVVLLLFVIGLELSMARIWAMRRLVFGLGGLQVGLSAIVIGAIAAAFGNSTEASVVLGLCLALSSTAIVMQLLTERHQLGSSTGQTSFSILLFQDLAVVPILFVVGMFGAGGGGSVVFGVVEAIAKAGMAIFGILLAGRLAIRPLFSIVGATGSRELFMAAVLLTVIGTSVVTAAAGLSMALGAFLAGLLLADTEYRHQVEVDIEPFKGLLLGVFFLSIGMGIDPAEVAEDLSLLLLGVVGLVAIKGGLLLAIALAFRLRLPVAVETALLLAGGGEFAFVVIGIAETRGIVAAPVAQFMLIVTGLSMMMTPLLARYARDLASRIETRDRPGRTNEPDRRQASLHRHVVIAGYGRVGQLLGNLLDEQSVPHVALDTDARLVTGYRKAGAAVFFGDASRTEILDRVGLGAAGAFVVTMDSMTASERIVSAVRKAHPKLPIFARARDAKHAERLLELGATVAIPETLEASLQLGEAMLVGAGLPDETAHQIVAAVRNRESLRYMKII